MNLDLEGARALTKGLCEGAADFTCDVMVFPPAVFIEAVMETVRQYGAVEKIAVGAQNCSQFENGAYTGEVSATMLRSIGCAACLVGHSERRQYFNEGHDVLAQKTNQLLGEGIVPVFCVGEELADRRAGTHFEVIKTQLEQGLFHLAASEMAKVVVAYEPVWAIGTGETASPAQAQEVHKFIRDLIAAKYGAGLADNTRVLYGGSVKPDNAKELFAEADIDGGLVGGASLKAVNFLDICQAG